MAEAGTFLIADISGYTEYLASADLEHGPAIATDLITRIVESLEPQFEVNKVEGDAVFAFTTSPELTGAELIEVIDGTYAGFYRRLLSVGQATTCGCSACGMVPRLDLKLIAHFGDFSRQRIAGRTELVGRDVIVAHRLLKNSLGFAGAGSGYVLVTDICVQRLAIDSEQEELTPHQESYDHLGEVKAWVGNLQDRLERRPRWQSAATALHTASCLLPAPPAEVWNLLAPGRSDSCVTHRLSTIHDVVEWRPYDRLVVEVQTSEASLLHEVSLDREGDGTVATVRWFKGRRRRHAPSWEEIRSRLATITATSLDQARDHFAPIA